MNGVATAIRYVVRFIVVWCVDALSLLLTAWFLPGMEIIGSQNSSALLIAVSAAFLMAVINFLIRPLVLLIARPLGWAALFCVGFLLNALTMVIAAKIIPGFDIDMVSSIIAGFVFALFNAVAIGILELDEEGSYYQNMIERKAREEQGERNHTKRALMVLEIDGLSYHHIKHAIEKGYLPTLKQMMDDGYHLSKVDCGLPSMTSACQAGIMYGENDDIPAYRWYDKTKGKLYVSATDAAELNTRYAHGQGLMRGGSSIMNMFNGDAKKSMFTMANMFEGSEEEKTARARDISLLMLNPYFLTRAFALFFVETVRELWEALMQKIKNVQPRINRLEGWYFFIRAAMCSLMRDISLEVAILDLMRGTPSIYMLYLGYDEVAHHSGPWTSDAMGDLKRLDKSIARLYRVLQERAPRQYEFVIISDHGQSFGATFQQRYHISIKEFIESKLPGVAVAQITGGDTGGEQGLRALSGELTNIQHEKTGVSRAVVANAQKLTDVGVSVRAQQEVKASITAYGSGNAVQVYFDAQKKKIHLPTLKKLYPGLVESLVAHEGIGLVMGYDTDMSVLALGKKGTRNLTTGKVTGTDPLIAYTKKKGVGASDIAVRVWQLKRVMEFAHAGDLWLISTVYPDGTVAAFEELVGNHGGLGGEQTDAFIFHSPSVKVHKTKSSVDVFHILNSVRSMHVRPMRQALVIDEWSKEMLMKGMKSKWINTAVGCLTLDKRAYMTVANSALLNGPALLLLGVSAFLIALNHKLGGVTLTLWVCNVFMTFAAAWLLTKKGSFSRSLRLAGFSSVFSLFLVVAFIPSISSLVYSVVMMTGLVSLWIGASVAHETNGWKTILIPVISTFLLGTSIVIMAVLLQGVSLTLESLRSIF